MRSLLPAILLSIAVPSSSSADEKLGDPYSAYKKGKYKKALEGFVDMQVERPDDPRMALHLGSAHYKMKNYADAEKSFGQAALAGEKRVRQQAFYNLGNTAYRRGKLEEAIEWYKRALQLDPQDRDAKFNLEFVRDQIRRRHEQAKKRQQQQQKQQKQCNRGQQGKQGDDDQKEKKKEQQGQQQQPQPQEQKEQQAAGAGQKQDDKQKKQQDGRQQSAAARPMTKEEAERYLQGLVEDRKKNLERRRARTARGQRSRPLKDW